MLFLSILLAGVLGCQNLGTTENLEKPIDPMEGISGETSPSEESYESKYYRAKRLYYDGINGDSKAFSTCEELIAELRSERPGNLRVLAYSGGIELFQAATTLMFWKKGSLAKSGLAKLDQAVTEAPEDPEIRFLRGACTFHIPSWFGRKEQSHKDLKAVAAGAESFVRNGQLDPRLAAAALFHQGLIFEDEDRDEEASKSYRRAVAIDPASPAGKDARKKLGDDLGSS